MTNSNSPSDDASDDTLVRSKLGWDGFQLVMAIAQLGQLSKVADALAMSHVTVLRKLAAIETRLGCRLFDRVRGKYSATASGARLIEAAHAMALVAAQAEMQVLGQDMRPSGQVRIATASVILANLLPPVLRQFATAFPDVTLEFLTGREHLNLSKRLADVSLRISDSVPEWLIGRKIAEIDFKVYGLKQARLKSPLQSVGQLTKQKRWICFESDTRDLKFDRWLMDQVPESAVFMRVDNFEHALTMVTAGLGIALLPSFLEADFPQLQALTPALPELRTPLWMITHQELRNTMRIKVVMQAIGPAITNMIKAKSANTP